MSGDSFHVRHQATPQYIATVLRGLSAGYDSPESLASYVRSNEHRPDLLDEQVTRLRRLGLILPPRLALSEMGHRCARIMQEQPSVLFEILHFLHYTLWDKRIPERNRLSWTYKAVCDELWSRNECIVDSRYLLDRLMMQLMAEFPAEPDFSVSVNTVRGVLSWLEVLEPPVIRDRRFSRRPFAAPELLMLLLDNLYSQLGLGYGELLMLDDDKAKRLAQACLVDIDALNDILLESRNRFSWFELHDGWGFSVRLREQPLFGDV
ncbi:MAG TPA: hypothetical protein GXX23_09300 [Firmicutes bacterium]|nr:hypothetical protein [Candidatus Fermentithermobacillaceae bacterium]